LWSVSKDKTIQCAQLHSLVTPSALTDEVYSVIDTNLGKVVDTRLAAHE
jgi:hypothetical protein